MKETLATLASGAAGVAFGLTAVVVAFYLRRLFTQRGTRRLLPAHVVGIGVSYGMLAGLGVVRVGTPSPHTPLWVYAVILTAFVIGDLALASIAVFLGRTGPRYRTDGERRDRP